VRGTQATYPVAVSLHTDGKIVDGDCECSWFQYNAQRSGPCKHILALREAATSAGGEAGAREDQWQKIMV
jgi:predicted nucleic acid-binding Zn finger protein